MTVITPRPDLVPTSSQAGDDLPEVTSSVVPHPYGGRGHSEAVDATTTDPRPPRPRDEVRSEHQDDRRFHLLVAHNTALCTQAGDTTTADLWGHYLTETPDNVDCLLCLAWMHS